MLSTPRFVAVYIILHELYDFDTFHYFDFCIERQASKIFIVYWFCPHFFLFESTELYVTFFPEFEFTMPIGEESDITTPGKIPCNSASM